MSRPRREASLPQWIPRRREVISLAYEHKLPYLTAAALLGKDVFLPTLKDAMENRRQKHKILGATRALLASVAGDCKTSIEALVFAGADPMMRAYGDHSIQDASATHMAAARGICNALSTLLVFDNLRAAADAVDDSGLAPAHVAAACGRVEAFRILVEHDNAAICVRVHRPYAWRAESRDILQKGSPPHGLDRLAPYGSFELAALTKFPPEMTRGATPAHMAAASGCNDVLKEIVRLAWEIEKGPAIRSLHEYRMSHSSTRRRFRAQNPERAAKLVGRRDELRDAERSFAYVCWQETFLKKRELPEVSQRWSGAGLETAVSECVACIIDDVASCTAGDIEHKWMEFHGIRAQDLLEWRRGDGSTPLLDASFCGHCETVRLLAELGADVRAVDNKGNSALHLAAASGNAPLAEMLIHEFELDVNIKAYQGDTPLHVAARRKERKDVIDVLLAHGADLNSTTARNETPLLCAAAYGSGEAFMTLLESGADPNISSLNMKDGSPAFALSQYDYFGLLIRLLEYAKENEIDLDLDQPFFQKRTILQNCVMGDAASKEAVKALLGLKANPNTFDENGWSPLLCAAVEGHSEILRLLLDNINDPLHATECTLNGWRALHVAACSAESPACMRLLIEFGADVNAILENEDGYAPLHLAVRENSVEKVRLLLSSGASCDRVSPSYGCTSLHVSASNGDIGPARLLIAAGASFFAVDNEGSPALHVAASQSRAQFLAFLLDAGCPVNLQDKKGRTALHIAASIDDPFCVRMLQSLLQHGADVNAIDGEGNTALHAACNAGSMSSVKVLLEAGINLRIRNCNDDDALLAAVRAGELRIAVYLESHGASFSECDAQGRSALHLAAVLDHVNLVRFLIRKGADIGATDYAGQSPLRIAATAENAEVLRLLLSHSGLGLNYFAPRILYTIESISSSDKLSIEGESDHERKIIVQDIDDNERQTCPICIDVFCDGDHVRVLSCGHTFHDNCTLEWLGGENISKNFSCPMCRQPLYSKLAKGEQLKYQDENAS